MTSLFGVENDLTGSVKVKKVSNKTLRTIKNNLIIELEITNSECRNVYFVT